MQIIVIILTVTVFILLLLKAIEEGNQLTINDWLQNENTEVNECRGGKAYHGHFVLVNGTALHWAVYYGQLEIAEQLLGQRAGISILSSYSKSKITPL